MNQKMSKWKWTQIQPPHEGVCADPKEVQSRCISFYKMLPHLPNPSLAHHTTFLGGGGFLSPSFPPKKISAFPIYWGANKDFFLTAGMDSTNDDLVETDSNFSKVRN